MSFEKLMTIYDPLKAGSIDGTDTVPHDRAIVRALYSNYVPKNSDKSTRTLFVGRLSPSTGAEGLKKFFRKYGRISSCRIVQDPVTLESRRYGFVRFSKKEDTTYARDRCNEAKLDNSVIIVDYENSHNMKGWIPRRLGGGFGGDKRSGQLRFGGRDRPFKTPIIVGENRTIKSDFDRKHSNCKKPRETSPDMIVNTSRDMNKDVSPDTNKGESRDRSNDKSSKYKRTERRDSDDIRENSERDYKNNDRNRDSRRRYRSRESSNCSKIEKRKRG